MRNPFKTSIVIAGLISVCSIAACAQTTTSESTGAYVDDASITTKVKAAILGDSALKVFEIHVLTDRDVVKLSGFVDSPAMISRASNVAIQVAGVRSVQNDLVVR
jgi:hyperosmotically inducible protein